MRSTRWVKTIVTIVFIGKASLLLAQNEKRQKSLTLKQKYSQNIESEKKMSPTRIDLGLGFPNLISLDLRRKITPSTWLGMGLGVIPIYLLVPQLQKSMSNELNEVYDMRVNPHANAFTWRTFFRSYLSGGKSFLSFNLDVLFINAGGTAELTNRDTGNSASVAKLDVTLIQPILSFSMGHQLWKTNSFVMEGGLGLSFLLSGAITSRVSGSLPAYLDVVPESRESIYDGMDDAKKDLSKLLDDTFNRYRVLPALYLQVFW